ncbi:hypothetical protein BV20DRAFT_1056470 [Pilatotrama ljubarskyi]|nr:hypothetical protein BV20DRAFT_1056470 [Pilatotrama ljubarskyi]
MSFKTIILAVTTAAALVSSVLAASLEISTPAIAKQCEPTTVEFVGGAGPFLLVRVSTIVSSSQGRVHYWPFRLPVLVLVRVRYRVQTDGQTIDQFTIPAGATSFVWGTNVAAGTPVSLELVDSTGEVAQTAEFVIAPGADTCTVV